MQKHGENRERKFINQEWLKRNTHYNVCTKNSSEAWFPKYVYLVERKRLLL